MSQRRIKEQYWNKGKHLHGKIGHIRTETPLVTVKDEQEALQRLAYLEDLQEQERLHIAPLKDGTSIFIPQKADDILGKNGKVIEHMYIHGYTEFEYGGITDGRWFTTYEAAGSALGDKVSILSDLMKEIEWLRSDIISLKEEIFRRDVMIENGLGWGDMGND